MAHSRGRDDRGEDVTDHHRRVDRRCPGHGAELDDPVRVMTETLRRSGADRGERRVQEHLRHGDDGGGAGCRRASTHEREREGPGEDDHGEHEPRRGSGAAREGV